MNKNRLILLEPLNKGLFLDHDFQSPTFVDKISERIQNYLENNGEFQ